MIAADQLLGAFGYTRSLTKLITSEITIHWIKHIASNLFQHIASNLIHYNMNGK